MTTQEAADKLEMSRPLIYQLCRAGLLGHERHGIGRGSIRITELDLAKYRVEARKKAARMLVSPVVYRPSPLRHLDPVD